MQLQYALCGGNPGPIWPHLQNIFSGGSSVTAISWLYRQRLGFALAADGKGGYVAETPEDESILPPPHTKQQKIFVTQFKGRDIAYAFTGMIFNKHRTFNLIEEAKAALNSVSDAQNIHDYIDRFSHRIKTAFDGAKTDGRILRYTKNPHCPDSSEDNVVVRVFFAGYFRKHQPSFAVVTLRHDNQVLRDPATRFETPPENEYFIGAPRIAKFVCGAEDHWVKAFAKPVPVNGSLDDLASRAEGFIRACSDPRAEGIDHSCKGIGGHVHVAEITPSGFKWLIAPIEEETHPVTVA